MPKKTLSAVSKDWISCAVLLFIFIALFAYNNYFSNSLVKHSIIVQARITDALAAPKRGKFAYYDFVLNGQSHTGSWFLPAFKNINDRHIIIGHYFPLVVDTTNYYNNKILFDIGNFKEYNLSYPDSLDWLKKYLK